MTPGTGPAPRELAAGRTASVVVGLEALVIAGFALFYVWELVQGHGTDVMVIVMSVVTMLVFVAGLGYVAVGLWLRHPRAQAPAIAANALFLALGVALFQFAPAWLAGGVVVAALLAVFGALLMGELD